MVKEDHEVVLDSDRFKYSKYILFQRGTSQRLHNLFSSSSTPQMEATIGASI